VWYLSYLIHISFHPLVAARLKGSAIMIWAPEGHTQNPDSIIHIPILMFSSNGVGLCDCVPPLASITLPQAGAPKSCQIFGPKETLSSLSHSIFVRAANCLRVKHSDLSSAFAGRTRGSWPSYLGSPPGFPLSSEVIIMVAYNILSYVGIYNNPRVLNLRGR